MCGHRQNFMARLHVHSLCPHAQHCILEKDAPLPFSCDSFPLLPPATSNNKRRKLGTTRVPEAKGHQGSSCQEQPVISFRGKIPNTRLSPRNRGTIIGAMFTMPSAGRLHAVQKRGTHLDFLFRQGPMGIYSTPRVQWHLLTQARFKDGVGSAMNFIGTGNLVRTRLLAKPLPLPSSSLVWLLVKHFELVLKTSSRSARAGFVRSEWGPGATTQL